MNNINTPSCTKLWTSQRNITKLPASGQLIIWFKSSHSFISHDSLRSSHSSLSEYRTFKCCKSDLQEPLSNEETIPEFMSRGDLDYKEPSVTWAVCVHHVDFFFKKFVNIHCSAYLKCSFIYTFLSYTITAPPLLSQKLTLQETGKTSECVWKAQARQRTTQC